MGRSVVLDRFDDAEAGAAAAAAHIATALAAAVSARGRASFVATGGRTPGPVYSILSRQPVDWSAVAVTLSDERWVDETSPDSNAAQVRRLLLTGPAASAGFVGLKTRHDSPEAATAEVEARLARLPWPFDMVMLGMGEDGHVASLFPGHPSLTGPAGSARRCAPVAAGAAGRPPHQPRMSLALEAITGARAVLIYATGAEKWEVLQRALAAGDPADLPVRAVLAGPAPVRVVWSA